MLVFSQQICGFFPIKTQLKAVSGQQIDSEG